MALKRCQNCEQLIGNLEEFHFFQGYVVCNKCKKILDKEADYAVPIEQDDYSQTTEIVEKKQYSKANYFRRHWQGGFPLGVSFWINMFLLNIIFVLIGTLLSADIITFHPVIFARITIFYILFILVIAYPWQIVGLWRSCNFHIECHNRFFWARTVQVLVVLGFISGLGSLNSAWPVYKGLAQLAFATDNKDGDYSLKLVKNDSLIHIDGTLDFGISKDISKILSESPKIGGIVLDTPGGRVYEGRKLAKLISAYNLDTYSLEGCYSAGTIAFIAGEKRFLGLGANLAYHQYKAGYGLDAYADMEAEHAKDLLFFQQQGVKDEFIDRLFDTSNDDLWYPTIDEMLDAGVIHGVVNPSDLMPIEYSGTSNELEDAFLEIPLYKTIKKYDPDTYKEIIVIFNELIEKGATKVEMQRAGSDLLGPMAFAAMSRTSDEAVIPFMHAIVNYLKNLNDISPILCLKAIYPKQYGSVSLTEHLSDDETKHLLNVFSKVIIDAYEKDNPPVDIESAELLVEELILELGSHVDNLELEALQNSDDYRDHCVAIIKLYELVLARDKKAAGNLLRYMFNEAE